MQVELSKQELELIVGVFANLSYELFLTLPEQALEERLWAILMGASE